MTNDKHFCNCPELSCKLHPSNHAQGCDPCIQKNLKAGEIPSCFFRMVHDDISQWNDFSVDGFAQFYAEHHKAEAES